MLLQDAFSSLSLADKCALSKSLSTHNDRNIGENNSSFGSSEKSGDIENVDFNVGVGGSVDSSFSDYNPIKLSRNTSQDLQGENNSSFGSSEKSGDIENVDFNVGVGFSDFFRHSRSQSMTSDDYDLESISILSVISVSAKESLDVAMSMMGQHELDQVDDEVRRIQNNVRGWLLRKNYVNLRDAAKTLQLAW
eukprot:CAMPEP_0119053476 /NCGR_PEP_ID=MMETSP1177-20130426/74456_1 /TAXON_ID=2985 /ORGANISM="Ochromonas sp, Strain CCMP1899" /LENGTH=192 /DNA_ID=CAMNT_0007033443 /DNA_START=617 /DNA_END=1192 /DNA_ORIENTATION=-